MSNAVTRFFARLFGRVDVRGPGAANPNETSARDNMLPDYRDAELRAQARRKALNALNDNANNKRKR